VYEPKSEAEDEATNDDPGCGVRGAGTTSGKPDNAEVEDITVTVPSRKA